MKRKSFGRDRGLTLRIIFTSGLLGLLYVVFAVVLFQALNVGLAPMLVIVLGLAAVQYWTSDRKSTRLNSSHRCISYAVFCSGQHLSLPSFPTRRSSDLI